MEHEILDVLKTRIKHRAYTISDIMDFEIAFDGTLSTKSSGQDFLKTKGLGEIKNVLSVGELPNLNPDFSQYATDGLIDDEKLFEYLRKNCYYETQQLDVKSNYWKLRVNLKTLFLNFCSLDEKYLERINYVKIKSFMGESEIGKKYETLPK